MLALILALPVLFLVAAAVFGAVVGAAWLRSLSTLFQGSAAAAALSGVAILAVLALVEVAARQIQRRRRPRWLCTPDVLGHSRVGEPSDVGGPAWALGQVASLGVPTSPCLIVTSALGSRLLSASAVLKETGKTGRLLPRSARRRLHRFLSSCRGAEVVVRSSFVLDEAHGSHAGVFETARASSQDPEAVVSAMLRVLASRDGNLAREYRRRRGLVTPLATGLILEAIVDADVEGTAGSRGLEGRADRAVIEYAKTRSPAKTVQFDFIDGEAKPLLVGSPQPETADWMRQLAWVALLAEERLGGPVHLDFVVFDGALRIRSVRRVPVAERRTFSCAWPVDLGTTRLPALFHDLRGGLPVQREAMAAALAQAGLSTGIVEDEVRYFEGVPYVDVAVPRRALGVIARALLLGDGARRLVALLAPVLPKKLPVFAEPSATGLAGWRELVAWQKKRYVPLVRRYFVLGTRAALLRSSRRLLLGGKGTRPVGHPVVRWLVERRAASVVAEVRRIEAHMAELERRMGEVAGSMMSQGTGGWSQMFAGDRHVHLNIAMVEQWFGGEAARENLDAKWRERKAVLERREGHDPVRCVHTPAIMESPSVDASMTPTELRGASVVPGVVQGTSATLTKRDPRAEAGSVVVLCDEVADDARAVMDSVGVVFLGRGACSAAAILAFELGLPAMLCPDARPGTIPHGRRLALDAKMGRVRY